jgi:hypothetical protein
MAEGTPPVQPHYVDIGERSIDLNTVFDGVAAIGSAVSAGAAWYGVTRQPQASQDQQSTAGPTIALPPGVGQEGD